MDGFDRHAEAPHSLFRRRCSAIDSIPQIPPQLVHSRRRSPVSTLSLVWRDVGGTRGPFGAPSVIQRVGKVLLPRQLNSTKALMFLNLRFGSSQIYSSKETEGKNPFFPHLRTNESYFFRAFIILDQTEETVSLLSL